MTHRKGVVHPEHLAVSDAQARERRRFCVTFGEPEPDPSRSEAQLEAAFGDLLAPLLADAADGWFFTLPGATKSKDGPAPSPPVPAGYLTGRRGRAEVNFAAPGIRTDRRFWWLARTKGLHVPFFTVPT